MFLVTLSLIFSHCLGFLNSPCNTDGTYQCSTRNNTVYSGSLSVSNCVFTNCGSFQFTGNNQLTLTNVTFINCGMIGNGILFLNAPSVINGITIIGNAVNLTGPAISVGSSTLSLTNGYISQTTVTGLAIASSTAVLNGIMFDNIQAINLVLQTTNAQASNITCQFGTSTCISATLTSNVTINGFTSQHMIANAASAHIMITNGAFLTVNNGLLLNGTNSNGDGGCVTVQGNLVLNNTIVRRCRSTGSGGFGYASTGLHSILTFYNSQVSDCVASVGNSFLYIWPATVNFLSNTIITVSSSSSQGIMTVGDGGYVYCSGNSTFMGTSAAGAGAILEIQELSAAVIDGCNFIGNTINGKGGVFSVEYQGTLTIANSNFIGNSATNGGVISAQDTSSVTINDNNVFTNNSATNYGGVLYMTVSSSVTFAGSGNQASGNSAVMGDFIYSSQIYSAGVQNFMSTGMNPGIQGSMFVNDPDVTMDIIGSQFLNNLPFVSPKALPSSFRFLPSNSLNMSNNGSLVTIDMFLEDSLPSFEIAPYTYFGFVYPVNYVNTIVVQAVEVAQNATLLGESIAAIVQNTTNSVIFSGLAIKNISPGSYMINFTQVTPYFVKSRNDSINDSPSVVVNVAQCERGVSIFVPNPSRCVQIRSASINVSSVAIGVSSFGTVLGVILMIYSAANLLGIMQYGSYAIISHNSVFFLSNISVGSFLAGILLIIKNYNSTSSVCNAVPWFENLSFFLVVYSLYCKAGRVYHVYRKTKEDNAQMQSKGTTSIDNALKNISKSKSTKKSQNTDGKEVSSATDAPRAPTYASEEEAGKMLTKLENDLIGTFMFLIVILVIFLSIWTSQFPATVQNNLVLDSFMVIDMCNKGSFDKIALLLRIVSVIVAVMYAYGVNDATEDFSEIKKILVALYNLLLFHGILYSVSDNVIADPITAEYISVVSIFLSFAVCLDLMIRLKVSASIFHGDSVRNAPPRKIGNSIDSTAQ